jgi:hypothetical protein
MSSRSTPDRSKNPRAASTEALLLRLDLAVETLENLDELGVDNRAELQALLRQLERQIDDPQAASAGEADTETETRN